MSEEWTTDLLHLNVDPIELVRGKNRQAREAARPANERSTLRGQPVPVCRAPIDKVRGRDCSRVFCGPDYDLLGNIEWLR